MDSLSLCGTLDRLLVLHVELGIELGAQLKDLERKITAILDELGRARARDPGICGPAKVGNELSRSSVPRKAVVAAVRRTTSHPEVQARGELCQPHQVRRVSSDDVSTRTSSIGRAASDGNPTRASKQRDQHAASTGDPLIERRQSAEGKYEVAAVGHGRALRADIRCEEGLSAAEGAGPMMSKGGARGASVSGGVLPARQTDMETLDLSTLAPRVKSLASTPEHSVQFTSSRSRGIIKRTASFPDDSCRSRGIIKRTASFPDDSCRSRGIIKRTASFPDDSAHVASISNKRLSSEGTSRPLAPYQRHLRTDLASTITDREPDVFKRTPPSGRSTEDSASSSIQHTGSSGQRWRPLVLHEQAWQNMLLRASSLPNNGRHLTADIHDDRHPLACNTQKIVDPEPDVSSGRQTIDDSLAVFGKRISLTPPGAV